ncbi:LCP family protein [Paenibacillus sp. GCM10012307]|uniref:LCP family protein n=1 Tax=Paenibacillus roseus TaxID=2798579 RepID=A0A934J3Y9_9BACL|nr:LCP family protein [Paenibacillus roseus]MBJ6362400.1 LCP family protein [Paenibacillus roseus]
MSAKDGKKTRKPWKKSWKMTFYSVLIIIVLAAGFTAYQGIGIYNVLDNLQKSPGESRFEQFTQTSYTEPPKWEGTERVSIAFLGGDGREENSNGIARSDSILVASIDPVTKKAHLFSVLRDTYVDIPDYGKQRINTAITLGGPNLAMETIGNLLGLKIQYYVYAEFEGFKSLIDAMGGIDFEVEKDMNYVDKADGHRYDIHLKKGMQHLDGDKALQYVRFRHDAMSDFTRTERQRNFMQAVATELQSTWNLLRMKEILESVQDYIETNLHVQDMLKLGQLGLGIHMAGSAQVPAMDQLYDLKVGGASVLGVQDEAKVHEYVQELLQQDDSLNNEDKAGQEGASAGSKDSTGSTPGSKPEDRKNRS